MLIIPAIDLMSGRCVRLKQGRFDDATVYGDPRAQIAEFAAGGAEWIHIVDLDGARDGARRQSGLIGELAGASPSKIQCGGGVRSRDDVARLLDAGASRVVIGSMAVKNAPATAKLFDEFGAERICCAFDVAETAAGEFDVRVHGWTAGAGVSIDQAISAYQGTDLAHILVTDISRDGILAGPNVDLMASLKSKHPSIRLQASGGVAALADIGALRDARADAAIVGRAFYENRFTLEAARAC
ncbi:MAG: 1-(5-phosphoribosyl)-5-[(5-phosphoribosylamino)methylideneamino]imidazole-4-carboxamide isomerase [Parvularculaceae bacterium]|nr:1-(5-phosphoribosyl)-5-[(5-phosphoribosylamino)methylideneamino]imidazole-4-carboxamide isomerase [Parvularculaceae bacterium]